MLAWNGSLGFSPHDGITSPVYCIYWLKSNHVHKYFHHLLRTDLYKLEFKRNCSGVIESRLRLYTDDFFQIYSLLPPLSEQTLSSDDDEIGLIAGFKERLQKIRWEEGLYDEEAEPKLMFPNIIDKSYPDGEWESGFCLDKFFELD